MKGGMIRISVAKFTMGCFLNQNGLLNGESNLRMRDTEVTDGIERQWFVKFHSFYLLLKTKRFSTTRKLNV